VRQKPRVLAEDFSGEAITIETLVHIVLAFNDSRQEKSLKYALKTSNKPT
jgi:hypothetical protein